MTAKEITRIAYQIGRIQGCVAAIDYSNALQIQEIKNILDDVAVNLEKIVDDSINA